jgi:hypothetical protein
MARQPGRPLCGARPCGRSQKEVHDLDKERPQCQINEIIAAGHAVPLQWVSDAHATGRAKYVVRGVRLQNLERQN